MHLIQLDALGMADGESPCWLNAVGGRLGIAAAPLMATDGGLTVTTEEKGIAASLLLNVFQCQSTTKLHVELLDADIADGMVFHACNQTGIATVGIADMDSADADVADLGGMESFGSSHSISQTNVYGSVADVGHCQVGDTDVFHLSAVNGFECESSAMGETTTADGDVAETTIRLRTQFDASRRTVAIGCSLRLCGACAVEQGSHIIATDLTIFNQHVFRGLGTT